MSESKTPLTDAELLKMPLTEIWAEDLERFADFTRQLERELADIKRDVAGAVYGTANISIHSDQMWELRQLGITPELLNNERTGRW